MVSSLNRTMIGLARLLEDDLDGLDRAMDRYGNPMLLCAYPADQAHPERLVRLTRPRVMVGPHRRLAWVNLCQAAFELRDHGRYRA